MIFLTYYLIKFIFNSSYLIITKTGNGIYQLIKKPTVNVKKNNLILDKETDNNTLDTIDPIKLNLLKEEIKKELKQEIKDSMEMNTLQN